MLATNDGPAAGLSNVPALDADVLGTTIGFFNLTVSFFGLRASCSRDRPDDVGVDGSDDDDNDADDEDGPAAIVGVMAAIALEVDAIDVCDETLDWCCLFGDSASRMTLVACAGNGLAALAKLCGTSVAMRSDDSPSSTSTMSTSSRSTEPSVEGVDVIVAVIEAVVSMSIGTGVVSDVSACTAGASVSTTKPNSSFVAGDGCVDRMKLMLPAMR